MGTVWMRPSKELTADEISQLQLAAHQVRREALRYGDTYLLAVAKSMLEILG